MNDNILDKDTFQIDVVDTGFEPGGATLGDMRMYHKVLEAIAPVQYKWKEMAERAFQVYFDNIHYNYDAAKKRCEQLDEKIEELADLNVGEEVTPEIRRLESRRRPFRRIVNSAPTFFKNSEDFLNDVMPKVENDFHSKLKELAARCETQGMDLDKVNVKCIRDTDDSFTLSFYEGSAKDFNAVISMAKGGGVAMQPHFRCKCYL